MRHSWLARFAIGVVTLVLSLAASSARAERIFDTEYVPVASVAQKAGMVCTWTVPQKKVVLSRKGRKVVLEADSRDFDLDGVRVFLGEPVVAHRGTLYVAQIDRDRLILPILNPRLVAGTAPQLRTIVIDAGHGGKDNGTANAKLKVKEKDMALDVALRLEKLLKAAGYRVVLTRRKDRFVPLPLRPAHATKVKGDLFISIHFNAIASASVSGCETYILTPQYQHSTSSDRRQPEDKVACTGNRTDPWNALLGFQMHRTVLGSLRNFDRGMKHARFAVLRDLTCPGLLLEAGYLSNEGEARKIGTPAWRQQIAQAVADGVAAYRAALPPRTR